MSIKVGVVTGKFAPLHSGHIYAITEAATQVDKLYVVLSYDQKFVDDLEPRLRGKMTLKKRLLWLKRTFSNLDHIKIIFVDETDFRSYPEGVEEWTATVNGIIPENIDVWFSSEPEYTWWIEKYFQCEHKVINPNRDIFPISATMIRENPYKHWEYLPSIVRKEFLLKVCLIGTESCGKSSLTKYLAKMFNTSWVEEYGRTYCEEDMCGDESLLSYDDYGLIASNRYYQEKQAELTANKVLFCDTNAFVTQFYCRLYEEATHHLVDAYIEEERYDIILELKDDVKWVADGLRINSDRTKTRELFKEMVDEYKLKNYSDYYEIKGDYKSRLDQAINIIKKYI